MPCVLVIGGGPAGATAALMSARLGLTSVVVEARTSAAHKVGECLPPSINPLLARLGLAERLRHDGHLASDGNRFVWGVATPAERDFIFGAQGTGWHLDRRRFEASLAAAAAAEGVDWRYGHRLVECTRRGGGWALTVKTPRRVETFAADFVIDASGRAARFAQRMGAARVSYDRLMGVAVYLESRAGEGCADSFTLVESVAAGWWYSARLPGEKLAVVYMTDDDLLDQSAARSMAGWFALLAKTEHTKRRVAEGNYRPRAAPRLLRANSTRLTAITGHRWLAVGDAVAAYDPLSSYGISSGMGAGFYAAAAIADYFQTDGNADALRTYEQLMDQAYAQYLLMQHEQYLAERRWPGEPFWQRRHATAADTYHNANIRLASPR